MVHGNEQPGMVKKRKMLCLFVGKMNCKIQGHGVHVKNRSFCMDSIGTESSENIRFWNDTKTKGQSSSTSYLMVYI